MRMRCAKGVLSGRIGFPATNKQASKQAKTTSAHSRIARAPSHVARTRRPSERKHRQMAAPPVESRHRYVPLALVFDIYAFTIS
jgi:hypothetical protein